MAIGFFSRLFGGGTSRSSANERRLLLQCRGDRELAERLIEAELSRRPDLSRAAAADRAADRWAHER